MTAAPEAVAESYEGAEGRVLHPGPRNRKDTSSQATTTTARTSHGPTAAAPGSPGPVPVVVRHCTAAAPTARSARCAVTASAAAVNGSLTAAPARAPASDDDGHGQRRQAAFGHVAQPLATVRRAQTGRWSEPESGHTPSRDGQAPDEEVVELAVRAPRRPRLALDRAPLAQEGVDRWAPKVHVAGQQHRLIAEHPVEHAGDRPEVQSRPMREVRHVGPGHPDRPPVDLDVERHHRPVGPVAPQPRERQDHGLDDRQAAQDRDAPAARLGLAVAGRVEHAGGERPLAVEEEGMTGGPPVEPAHPAGGGGRVGARHGVRGRGDLGHP